MIKVGENYLEYEIPALKLPILKSLEEDTIQFVMDAIYSQVVLLIDIAAIRLINAAHQAAYDKASEQLVIISMEKGEDSDAYKQALVVAVAAMRDVMHFNG